jgi:hypothetical protein
MRYEAPMVPEQLESALFAVNGDNVDALRPPCEGSSEVRRCG